MDERAGRVAITKGRLSELGVLKDHRVRVLADRGNLPHAGRLDSLDADRSRWEQSTEQRPLIAEPDTNWLVPVPRLELLTPVLGDVVREHDLAIVTSNDALAPWQLDQDRSHDAIVPAGTTEASEPERTRTSIAASGSDRFKMLVPERKRVPPAIAAVAWRWSCAGSIFGGPGPSGDEGPRRR